MVIASESDGHEYIAEAQIRSRPRLIAGDKSFRELVRAGNDSIAVRAEEFTIGRRRLVLVVAGDAMTAVHLAGLTELARAISDYEEFAQDVLLPRRHSSQVRERWRQLVKTISGIGLADTDEAGVIAWRFARHLYVVRWDLEGSVAQTRADTINELARIWSPYDDARAVALFRRLDETASSLVPLGGRMDSPALVTQLGELLADSHLLSSPNRRTVLAAHLRRPEARIAGRLRELGVVEERADLIAEAMMQSDLRADVSSLSPGRVIGFREDVGAGKSTFGDLLLYGKLREIEEGEATAIPVLIDAQTVDGTLESAARAAALGLGDPCLVGCTLILDGIDEVAISRARSLISEAHAQVRHWANTSVVLLSRPLTGVTEGTDWRAIRLLSEGEAAALLVAVTGDKPHVALSGQSIQVREAILRPLFAVLLGVWLTRQSGRSPSSSAELIGHLVSRTLDRLEGMQTEGHELLRRLATRSLMAGGGRVPLGDVAGGIDGEGILRRTGLVRIDVRGQASLSLAILTDWFAAQHLLVEPGIIDTVRSDADGLMRWRYAIASAVSRSSFDRTAHLIEAVAEVAPAVAAWIVDHAIVNGHTPRQDPTEGRELGRRLVYARQAWARVLGPLGAAVTPTARDGHSFATLGVRAHGGWLSGAWYCGAEALPPVVDLPPGLNPFTADPEGEWYGFFGSIEGHQDSWPWRWSWERVVSKLAALLRSGALVEGAEALRDENDWALAQIIVGRRPSAIAPPIHMHEVEQAVQAVRSLGASGGRNFAGIWTIRAAERLMVRLREQARDEIGSPWYGPTQSGTHVLEWWSIEAHIRRARAITRAALNAYEYAVATWLPAFRGQLRTVRLAPLRVVGSVAPTPLGSIQPYTFRWYLEPVAWRDGIEDDWRVMSLDEMRSDDERLMTTYDRRMAQRPEAPSITIHSGMPALTSGRPAAVLAVDMLWSDLGEWGWVSGAAPFELDMLLSATM